MALNYQIFVFYLFIFDFCVILFLMEINKNASNSDILIELGNRVKAFRIRKAYTQAEFSKVSGISKGTISNIESGKSVQFENVLKVLRALDCLNSLEILLPPAESTPMELLREKSENKRQRVRKTVKNQSRNQQGFVWGKDI